MAAQCSSGPQGSQAGPPMLAIHGRHLATARAAAQQMSWAIFTWRPRENRTTFGVPIETQQYWITI
ncbi:MAG: hypothetical protein AMS22_04285 [Thiotrichales bacterium SG8_50]|nr:MAG: hypothetical protein AMS22_04285 [Thiotrichales bacterium SG8_50]